MSPEKLLQERKELFLKTKYANEVRVNAYLEKIFSMREKEPEWFRSVQFPKGRTAKEVLPAMYEEEFDIEKFKEQYAALKAVDAQIQHVIAAINAEAERELKGN